MNNDFSIKKYEEIIEEVKSNYEVVNYIDYSTQKTGQALLRHDVDISIPSALELAKVEAKHDVRSTFFILITSDFYNAFTSENIKFVKEIKDLGHYFGIHFDPVTLGVNDESSLLDFIDTEKKIMNKYLDVEVNSISFHNPTTFEMDICKHSFIGLINAYSEKIQKSSKYCSDSNGYWRFESIDEVIASKPDNLHFLTHPIWWGEEGVLPRNKVQSYLSRSSQRTLLDYDELLKKSGRENKRD